MHQIHIRSDCPKCLIMLLRTCTWSLLSCDIEEHLVTDLPHGLLFNNEWLCYMSDHWISCGGMHNRWCLCYHISTCFLHVYPAEVSMWPCVDILFSSILRILYNSWLNICWSLYALVWYWTILIFTFYQWLHRFQLLWSLHTHVMVCNTFGSCDISWFNHPAGSWFGVCGI